MQEKSLIKENILKFVEYKGITKYEFYKLTGITRGVLDQNNGMSEGGIARFLAYFKDVNAEWLITGKGQMLKQNNPYQTEENVFSIVKEETPNYRVGLNEGIPLLPINAMAGFFQGETKILEHECDRYVIPIFKEAEFLIPVKGSSMYPKYNSGDIVACKRMPLDTFFQWNKVYVLDTEQGALIKRVKKGNNDESIMIVSDNANYEPFELKRSKIYNIALVVGVIRLE